MTETLAQAIPEIPQPGETGFQFLNVVIQPFQQIPAVFGVMLAQLIQAGQLDLLALDKDIGLVTLTCFIQKMQETELQGDD